MQKVIILGMQNEDGKYLHKELIFDKAVEIDVNKIENFSISEKYELSSDVNFCEKGEIVIAHTLLDYEDLEKIEDFYNFIITMFKEQGSTLVNDGFITEDELIDRYEFESELFY